MSFTITAPSKTFLVGDYVALNGGPTLVLNTSPRFELKITPQNSQTSFNVIGINSDSPAGKFLQQNSHDFLSHHLEFIDPHHNVGGFGASSAQFAMVMVAQQLIKLNAIQNLPERKNNTTENTVSITDLNNPLSENKDPLSADINQIIQLNKESILAIYQQYAWSGQGQAPSGADVIAQCIGGITYYHRAEHKIEQLTWPFKDIDFCLIRTGKKIATHQHLIELPYINTQALAEIVTQTYQSLIESNSAQFITAINQYAATLQKQQLVAGPTLDLLQMLKSIPSILASKGCGALGADVILAIFEIKQRTALLNSLNKLEMTPVICGHEQMSQGMHCITTGQSRSKF